MNVKIIYTGIDHPNHIKALDKFSVGVQKCGDIVEATYPTDNEPDVYVIFGSWKDRDQPHHNAKREVVASGKPFVVIETPIFGRKPVKEYIQDDCFRVGLNGFLNNRGKFIPDNFYPDDSRLKMMAERLKVNIQPMRVPNKNMILLALQLPGDASLEGTDINTWFKGWIEALNGVTLQKVCRFPQLPRDYDRDILNYAEDNGWLFQEGTWSNLEHSLMHAKFTISYSSGFGVDSLIAGTPCIVDSDASFAYELSHKGKKNLHSIYTPTDILREQWLSRLSYHQWFIEEMESGECWKHIKSML